MHWLVFYHWPHPQLNLYICTLYSTKVEVHLLGHCVSQESFHRTSIIISILASIIKPVNNPYCCWKDNFQKKIRQNSKVSLTGHKTLLVSLFCDNQVFRYDFSPNPTPLFKSFCQNEFKNFQSQFTSIKKGPGLPRDLCVGDSSWVNYIGKDDDKRKVVVDRVIYPFMYINNSNNRVCWPQLIGCNG